MAKTARSALKTYKWKRKNPSFPSYVCRENLTKERKNSVLPIPGGGAIELPGGGNYEKSDG